jgi:hypothetical protein
MIIIMLDVTLPFHSWIPRSQGFFSVIAAHCRKITVEISLLSIMIVGMRYFQWERLGSALHFI